MQAGSVPGFQVPESYGLVDGAGCEDGLTHANVKAGNLRRVKRHQKQLELCLQAIHTDTAQSASSLKSSSSSSSFLRATTRTY